jgi:methenyltetrahydrofolate cyclohydrolase
LRIEDDRSRKASDYRICRRSGYPSVMTSLTHLRVVDLLDAFASNDPLPAGGSAAALTGAVGASILLMVATLPKTRTGGPSETSVLASAAVRLRPLRDQLTELIQRDSESYSSLLVAIRAPRGTEQERARRQEDILAATHLATEVPLQTIRASAIALHTATVVAENGSRAASGDVAAAVELLLGAIRAAGHSVDSNLAALKDSDYVARVRAERQHLESETQTDAARAREALVG